MFREISKIAGDDPGKCHVCGVHNFVFVDENGDQYCEDCLESWDDGTKDIKGQFIDGYPLDLS